jgi:hypothetical protein
VGAARENGYLDLDVLPVAYAGSRFTSSLFFGCYRRGGPLRQARQRREREEPKSKSLFIIDLALAHVG